MSNPKHSDDALILLFPNIELFQYYYSNVVGIGGFTVKQRSRPGVRRQISEQGGEGETAEPKAEGVYKYIFIIPSHNDV